ncbi:MAG: UDP-N-acetylmuramoyl-tripeptide--D-alanyl-D-alanine ligase [Leptospira sp.]|nr:UDP-N-acetylmuramoyl-tripeptide--D-alanyl-D-alanine ligase [Leptospira sp.]
METKVEKRIALFEEFHYKASEIRNVFSINKSSLRLDQSGHTNRETDIEFSSITNSSKEACNGSLFIPLIAERDGHEFIESAVHNGASGFLCNTDHSILKKLPPEVADLAIEVEDTWKALGQLGRFHRNKFHPIVIGITGSSGKTTTKELLASCFSHLPSENLVVTSKNYNNEIGVPFTLFRIHDRTKYVILEMGMNHRGEILKLTEIAAPNHCIITNIGSAHIENLKTQEEIAREKSDIVKGMQIPGKLFLPDNISFPEIVRENIKKSNAEITFWNSKSDKQKLFIQETYPHGYKLQWKGLSFNWNHPGEKILSNLSGVLHCSSFLGIEDKVLVSNIQKYKTEGSRLKIIQSYYKIIDDSYNANPESMESSIQVTGQIADRKPFACILGDMKELGDYADFYHQKIGEILSQSQARYVISFGIDSQKITEAVTNPEIKKIHFSADPDESTIPALVDWIKVNIIEGTTILVKGSRSMKMERIVEKILDDTTSA